MTVDEKGLEAAARALFAEDERTSPVRMNTPWGNLRQYRKDAYRVEARAAITAYEAAKTAEGPVAWTYELASTVNQQTGERGGWKPWLSWHKPYVPKDAIRNLTPLYAAPPPPQVTHE